MAKILVVVVRLARLRRVAKFWFWWWWCLGLRDGRSGCVVRLAVAAITWQEGGKVGVDWVISFLNFLRLN